jgi:hypothetical protein
VRVVEWIVAALSRRPALSEKPGLHNTCVASEKPAQAVVGVQLELAIVEWLKGRLGLQINGGI